MMVLAHRGAHGPGRPQNGLAAIAAAAEHADGVEVDVRRTADGRLILCHDRHLPDGRPIAALAKREIDAALGHATAGLEEALELAPDLFWNLELKDRAVAGEVAGLLRRRGDRTRVLVSAFDHAAAMEGAADTAARVGFLVSHLPRGAGDLAGPPPGVDTLVWNFEFSSSTMRRAARDLGWVNAVYGVVDPEELDDDLRGDPRTIVITDYPERFR